MSKQKPIPIHLSFPTHKFPFQPKRRYPVVIRPPIYIHELCAVDSPKLICNRMFMNYLWIRTRAYAIMISTTRKQYELRREPNAAPISCVTIPIRNYLGVIPYTYGSRIPTRTGARIRVKLVHPYIPLWRDCACMRACYAWISATTSQTSLCTEVKRGTKTARNSSSRR